MTICTSGSQLHSYHCLIWMKFRKLCNNNIRTLSIKVHHTTLEYWICKASLQLLDVRAHLKATTIQCKDCTRDSKITTYFIFFAVVVYGHHHFVSQHFSSQYKAICAHCKPQQKFKIHHISQGFGIANVEEGSTILALDLVHGVFCHDPHF